MQGFGYGAEDFDAGLSEAIDRDPEAAQDVYASAGRTAAGRPAGSLVSGTLLGPEFGGPPPGDDEDTGPGQHGHAGSGFHAHTSHHEFAGPGIRRTWGLGITASAARATRKPYLVPKRKPAPGVAHAAARGDAASAGKTGPDSSAAPGRLVAGPGRTARRPGRAR